jgi:hypothetical protein
MFALLALSLSAALSQERPLAVEVDSNRHEVVLTVGPLGPDGPAREHHQHGSAHADAPTTLFGWERFRWPVDGWLRGFRLSASACGRPAESRSTLHHLIIANLARRQLIHPAMERLFAVGSETPDVVLPKTVGIPLSQGTPLAIRIAWSPPPGEPCAVTYRLALLWSPKNLVPEPTSVLPFYVDVYHEDVLASNVFSLPPGRSVQSLDFRLPTSGRLLAAGAHLHWLGKQVALVELGGGDTLSRLRAQPDSESNTLRIERRLYGVGGRGLKLEGNADYRVVSEYFNPADSVLPDGGMAHFVGLFAPDRSAAWPAPDWTDPVLAEDYRRVCGRSYPGCD